MVFLLRGFVFLLKLSFPLQLYIITLFCLQKYKPRPLPTPSPTREYDFLGLMYLMYTIIAIYNNKKNVRPFFACPFVQKLKCKVANYKEQRFK